MLGYLTELTDFCMANWWNCKFDFQFSEQTVISRRYVVKIESWPSCATVAKVFA